MVVTIPAIRPQFNHRGTGDTVDEEYHPMFKHATIAILFCVSLARMSASQVVINEIVTDPQHDWSDSVGGNGAQFDGVPGVAVPTLSDEWIELKNTSAVAIDVTGWSVAMIDSTPEVEVLGSGAAVLVFSSGGSLASFQPGEYLVIGNPAGTMNDAITIEISDASAALVDAAVLGPGGAPDGNASSPSDEAVARCPDGIDTDMDANDFVKLPATIGGPNSLFSDGFESGDTSKWSAAVLQ